MAISSKTLIISIYLLHYLARIPKYTFFSNFSRNNENEYELTKLWQYVIKAYENQLLKKAEDDEAKVFYIKMKGDYNRYIAEYAEGDLKK